jgi:hypothetical protein
MASTKYPDKYVALNNQASKNLVLVAKIEGIDTYFSLVDLYTKIRYGDPGIFYGEPGLVYGGLRLRGDVKSYLTLNGTLTIAQRLEPEQGRASISTFTLIFLDKDGYFTNLVSPGQMVDEVLGNKEVKIYLGFQNSSFPEDFFVVFRGNVVTVSVQGPEVTLALADPNQKKRQTVFKPGLTYLSSPIDNSVTTIPVTATDSFYTPVLGPDSTYDPNVEIFIKIDNEWMKVNSQTGTSFSVTRDTPPVGEIATGAAAHASGVQVDGGLQLGTDAASPRGINTITAALKIMLSGWGGPWITGQAALALGKTSDILHPETNVIRLPTSKDAIEDYGLTVGDWVTVSGSTMGNNGTYQITDIDQDVAGNLNRLLYIDTNLTPEDGGTLAFRSQFDTLPLGAGVKMKPTEVDVATHVSTRNQFFLKSDNHLQFALLTETTGKDFIESECFLPFGIYSLTRYGRSSIGYTRPPITTQSLIILDINNIKNPEKIQVARSLVNRRFYNEVDYRFDKTESAGTFASVSDWSDEDSTALFGQTSLLPIDSSGLRTALSAETLLARRAPAFLTRYKNVAIEINLSVLWAVGSLIEVGDAVALKDEGDLKIPNFVTGQRNIGTQLFEVIDRKLNVVNGDAQLLLLGGIFDSRFDRYGSISPSSKLAAGSTTTVLKIKPSFGSLFGSNEFKKWLDYIGLKIRVHSRDYSIDEEVVLKDVPLATPNTLTLASALGFSPTEDLIVDLARYSTSTDKTDQQFAKLAHAFLSPSVAVASGSSSTVFSVGSGDAAKFQEGALVKLHDRLYSQVSPEVKVLTVVGTTITVDTALGFTPSNLHTVEFIGFADAQGAYRFL